MLSAVQDEEQAHLSDRTGKSRILSVDTMRGVAMILVIMQHAYHLIDPSKVPAIANYVIYGITRMASVGFMAVSGMMIGYFLFCRPDWKQVQVRFAKRAVLLILFAHPAISLIRFYYAETDRMQHFLSSLYLEYQITDTIALSLLIAPFILIHIRSAGRLVLIIAALVATPLISAYFQPDSGILMTLKVALFGEIGHESNLLVTWPLVPWLAIFLCGSIIGEMLASVKKGKTSISALVYRMQKSALVLAIVGVVLTLGYKLLKMQFGDTWDPRLFNAIYPSRSTSFLPIYLAVLLAAFSLLMVRIDTRRKYDRASWFASIFGRTSLFTYVTQFAAVHTAPSLLGLRGHLNLWQYVVLFAVGTLATWLVAYAYGRMRGWITADDYRRLAGN